MRDRLQIAGAGLVLVLLAYAFVASVTFSFRHPWATDMEKLIYTRQVLTFGRVSYDEARPR